MKYLRSFLYRKKGILALTLLLLTGQVVGTLFIPYLIAEIVDRGIIQGDMTAILNVGIKMVVVSLITALISVLGSYFSADLAASFGRHMREAVFRKSQELSLNQFEGIGVPSMITRATSDISALQQTIGMTLQLIVPAPLIIASSVVMTFRINSTLTLLLLGSILLFMIPAVFILKKSGPLSAQIQVKMDKINRVVREFITGIRVIRAFDNSNYERDRCGDAFEGYANHMIRLNRLFSVLNPAVWLVIGFSMAAIVWVGGVLSVKGTMQIGEITAVTEYTVITLSYLIMAIMAVVLLPKMFACLSRLEEVLDQTPEITDSPQAAALILQEDAPILEFSHVTFSYPGAESPVLKDLSFQCFAGETTAIIGGTGSGKSTVANLILRLTDISEGQIRFRGNTICNLTQHELRDQIGFVPQRAFLFSGTIRDNLLMGLPGATDEEIEQALKTAQAESFVDSLPLGIYAPVSQNGSNFSGGQKQRLAIARALIKKVPLLIFDDSFSALDFKTDANLRRALKETANDNAKLIIAQRIHTIMDADRIIVLDEGEIAGMGTHEQLLESCRVYRDIAESQLSRQEVNEHEIQ